MTKILNHINTYADLTAYNNDMGKEDFSPPFCISI